MRCLLRTARCILVISALVLCHDLAHADPLPSWNDGPAKQAITDFVANVTRKGSADYVEPAARIAVFDNDGTLWAEQPVYFQFAFAVHRIQQLAPKHPEWKTQQPFKGILENDPSAVAASGEQGVLQILATTHAGMSTDTFDTLVATWLTTAKHPKLARRYIELVYQPMLELLQYLREYDFKTFIVSGGGAEFIRVFAEQVYGIPPEQVVGSTGAVKYDAAGGKPVLIKEDKVEYVNDGPGKPVGIHRFIGRRPIIAFGNSDGDQQMLQWTAARNGPSLVALIHHTDSDREFAYDRQSSIGKLDKALDEAHVRRWLVVDMKEDWLRVFPSPSP